MYIFAHMYRKISIACMTVSPYSSSNNLLVQTEIGPSMAHRVPYSRLKSTGKIQILQL